MSETIPGSKVVAEDVLGLAWTYGGHHEIANGDENPLPGLD